MTIGTAILVAWRNWRKIPAPTENYRRGHRQAASYGVETDLDHFDSAVTSIGNAWMEGRDWDYSKRCIQELQDAAALRRELVSIGLMPDSERRITEFLAAGERLLRAILSEADPNTANQF